MDSAGTGRGRKGPRPDVEPTVDGPGLADGTPAAPGHAACTLADLIDTLGPGVLRVAVAPLGLAVPLGTPQFYDPIDDRQDYQGSLVLGLGIDARRAETVSLVQSLAEQGAGALVLKGQADPPPRLREAAREASMALLTIPPDASWAQVHVFARTAMAAAGSAARPDGSAGPISNLFRLADAISALVGGPTTIEDPDSMILAYSSGDAPIDLPRQRTILGHRVPEEWVQRLQQAGVFKQLLSSDEVISFEDPEGEMRPRLAVSVRAGGELLGSIWVAEGASPFTPTARQALREAASSAALHLIQHRNLQDFARRRRSDGVRALLQGDIPTDSGSEALDHPPGGLLTILAFQVYGIPAADIALKSQRFLDLVTLYCEAYRRNAAAAIIGETIFLLIAEPERQPGRTRTFARDVLDRARETLKAPIRAAMSSRSCSMDDVLRLRREAEQVLRVIAGNPSLGPVASIEDLRSQAVLLELRDFAHRNASVLEGRLQLLVEEDLKRGTPYVQTLRSYLEHFGDIPAAAATIPVHPNTFRYRLRRLATIAGIDLDDPDERLVLQIQLRLTG